MSDQLKSCPYEETEPVIWHCCLKEGHEGEHSSYNYNHVASVKEHTGTASAMQQPMVDVGALWDKWSEKDEQNQRLMCWGNFEYALQEALRGSYTREDMIRFRHFDCSDAVSGEQALRQYDTERGKSNG